jgi:predicted esterase
LAVAFHGYGENAETAMDQLRATAAKCRWVHHWLAIEALHAFYDRKGERVYRSWMTRDLRLEAIADNTAYVAQVLDRVRPIVGWNCPVVFVGFSQGVAMAWRAAVRAGHGAAGLLALAGDIPPELRELPPEVPLPQRVWLARGTEETWYTEEKLASDVAWLRSRGICPEVLTFPGGHQWLPEVHETLASLLDTVVV